MVDAVLDVRSPIGHSEDPLGVRFVLGKEQGYLPIAIEVSLSEFGINGFSPCADCVQALCTATSATAAANVQVKTTGRRVFLRGAAPDDLDVP